MKRWHIISCEYPPQIGGVSDYTRLLAHQLLNAGDDVHVWAPAYQGEPEFLQGRGVAVHRSLGEFRQSALTNTEGLIKEVDPEQARTILVQWVPHGYGQRAMNLGFCRWIGHLAQSGNQVSLMIHEPYLEFSGSWKQRLVALVHRRMIRTLLRSSARVLISIPGWERYLRPYAPEGRQFEWLPIPATIPVANSKEAVSALREKLSQNHPIIGHLGTYSAEVTKFLRPALFTTLKDLPETHALLMGKDSERFASAMTAEAPEFKARIHSTGLLSDADLSHHIATCDVMLQPYPDGLSTRRTSLMNVLAQGIAVVSNTGHLTEDFWPSSAAAALSPVHEPGRLAEDCIRLLRDTAARDRLAQAGLALYRSRFDWPHVIAALRSSPQTYVAHSK